MLFLFLYRFLAYKGHHHCSQSPCIHVMLIGDSSHVLASHCAAIFSASNMPVSLGPHVMARLQEGATGYGLKNTFVQDIATKIRHLFQVGHRISAFISHQILTQLAQLPKVHKPDGPKNLASLLPRVDQVLPSITKRVSHDDISEL